MPLSSTLPYLLGLLLSVVLLHSGAAQETVLSQEDFVHQYVSAFKAHDQERMHQLVETHRALAYINGQKYLDKYLRATLAERPEEATRLLALAQQLAADYQQVFHEAEPVNQVTRYQQWSLEEKRRKVQADTLELDAIDMQKRGDWQAALHTYEAALSLYQQLGDRREEGTIVMLMGFVYMQHREYTQALEHLQQALELFQALKDRQSAGRVLNHLGHIYTTRGQYTEALESYQQALGLFQALKDRQGAGEAFHGLGSLYYALGQYGKALESHQQALQLFQALKDPPHTGMILKSLGFIYAQLGQYTQALTMLQQTLTMFHTPKERLLEGGARLMLGWVYTLDRQYMQAQQELEQALAIFRAQDYHLGEAETFNILGELHRRMEQFQEALENYQQALDIFRRQQGFHFLEGDALGNMGWVYERLGQPQKALEYFQDALAAFTAQGDPDGLWRLHAYTARVLATLRDIPAALDHYAMAVRILDTLRGSLGSTELKISFLAADTAKLDVYREAVTFLLTLHEQDPTQGYATKAIAYAERGKARALLDNLAEARAQLRTSAQPHLLTQEQQLYDRLAAARQQVQQAQNETQRRLAHEEITALESELAALQQTLRTTNPRFAAWHTPEPVTLADIQTRVLHEGEVLLEYFWGTHALHLFIVDHTGLRVSLTLPVNERELTTTLEQFLQPLRQLRHARELQHFDLRLAHTLYQQVVQPATPYLGTAKTLVIVPDGVLHYLPYELLVASPVPPLAALQDIFAAYGDASYLVRQYAIVYAPSASVLRPELLTPVAPTARPKILLALAPSIEDLQASQQEVLKLREVFSRDITTLLGSQATKEALWTQAQDYRYVHLATHGSVNENAPMYSALKLAQNNVLQTYEIFTLVLRADLVTLSACETSLGAFKRGEGIVGLVQAFLYAGTPSVIASLWRVNDASTAELMTAFYQHLREGKPKGEALRQAKLAMLEKKSTLYVHPYFWAPFVLTGAWR